MTSEHHLFVWSALNCWYIASHVKLIQNQYISFYRRYIEKQKKKEIGKESQVIKLTKLYLYQNTYTYNSIAITILFFLIFYINFSKGVTFKSFQVRVNFWSSFHWQTSFHCQVLCDKYFRSLSFLTLVLSLLQL